MNSRPQLTVVATAKRQFRSFVRHFGYDVHRIGPDEAPYGSGIDAIIRQVAPYTTTGRHRIAALCDAINYVERKNIGGDFVECGVWKGGSSMAAALALKAVGSTHRRLYLYDTFEGMPEPGDFDRTAFTGESASDLLARTPKGTDGAWRFAPLEGVRTNLESTGYPSDRIVLVKGRVEETIPKQMPDQIAVLRLDTDWYESTRHELIHLYPRLVSGGVIIIDDYGHWEGARKAVDEYLVGTRDIFLARIDHTGRIGIKM